MGLSPELASAIRGLQTELSRMSSRLSMVEANQRTDQVTNASVENGSLVFNDSAGNPQVVLGLQPDGSFAHASVTSTVPVAPDAPLTGPGVLSAMVTWDGGMSDGSAPLADFAGVQVHLSAASGFAPGPATLQGTMPGAGTFGVGGLAAGTTYYAVLVAYNVAGNTSPAGAQAPVIPQSVPANIPPGAISALQLQTGSITAAQLAANAGILGQQIAGQTITGANIAAGTITANLVAAGIIIAGVIDGTVVSAPTINGGQVNGAVFTGSNWIENLAGSFYYSGAPAVGNLIASVAGAGGQDGEGNLYEGGVNAYVTVAGITFAVGLNVTGATGGPGLSILDTAHPPYAPAGVFGMASNGSSKLAQAYLASGAVTSSDQQATVQVFSAGESAVAGGVATVSAGSVQIGGAATLQVNDNRGAVILGNPLAAPPAATGFPAIYADLAGNAGYVHGVDSNAYRTGRFASAAASAQAITSTSPSLVAGSQISIAAGLNYHITGAVNYTGSQAAGTAAFGFGGGTARVSHADGRAWFVTGSAVANPSVWSGALALAVGPTLTTGLQRWEFEIWIACAASGTLLLRAQEGTSGDSFTVNSCYVRAETYG